jgi:hypothetical protein
MTDCCVPATRTASAIRPSWQDAREARRKVLAKVRARRRLMQQGIVAKASQSPRTPHHHQGPLDVDPVSNTMQHVKVPSA